MRKHYPLDPTTGAENQALLPWSDGVPATGTEGSYPGQLLFTDMEAEILAAIDAAGLPRTGGDLTQLAQSIAIGIYLGTFGGNANTLVAAIPGPTLIGAMPIGMQFRGLVGPVTNGGNVTINLQGFTTNPGAKPLLKRDGATQLSQGDLPPNTEIRFWWDGTNYRFGGAAQSDTSNQLATLKSLQNIQQFRNATRTILAGTTAPVLAWTPTSPGGLSSYVKKSATSSLLVFMELINFTTGLGAAIVNLNIGALARQSVASVGVPNYISIGQIPKIDLITAADLGNPAAGTALPLSITTFRPDGQSWSQTMNPTTADSNQFPPSTASTSVLIIGEIEPTA